jgi:hypothetical protein
MTADLLRRQMRNYLNFRLSFDYCVGNVDICDANFLVDIKYTHILIDCLFSYSHSTTQLSFSGY